MLTGSSFRKQFRRTMKSSFLALVMFAGGFTQQSATAGELPAWGEGVVIVPASAAPETAVARPSRPGFVRGKVVAFKSSNPAGSIIVSTQRKVLYFILGQGKAVQYRVATAKPGFEWAGAHKVSSKKVWPDWRPPEEMRERRPDLPEFMAGGPEIRWARARFILAVRSIAFMAPMIRSPSARRPHLAASGCSMPMLKNCTGS